MLRNLTDKFRFLVAGIPFTQRHVAIRILLHSFFLFLLWMYMESIDSTHDSWRGKLNVAIMLAAYFNIYYFILQCRLPLMILILILEPCLLYLILILPVFGSNAAFGYMLILLYITPVLHIAYFELLYRLRKELAQSERNNNTLQDV